MALSDIIGKGKRDSQDLEKKYIDKMVSRLENCEKEYAKSNKLRRICLFSKDHV